MQILFLTLALASLHQANTQASSSLSQPQSVLATSGSQEGKTNNEIASEREASFISIPAKTPVKFIMASGVSSKTAKPGDQFQLKVAEGLKINGMLTIPSGTPATGEVIHAQKSSIFGKAGELLLTIRYIDLQEQKIKMRSFQPYQGHDISRATASSALIIGPLAAFIHGGEIEIPENTMVQALVSADSTVRLGKITAETNNNPLQITRPSTNGDSK
ncbi:MAG TPA: hypothetical protein PLF92_12720 [Arenimonas sp.]|nr:hypothetical protein [Arenimonas sp.]HOZ04360.1 hypothetical protein [Arenimonas sp.]HPW33763.1 hypothetical protein [Arenimonas sp.]